jgi:hypothetical protein
MKLLVMALSLVLLACGGRADAEGSSSVEPSEAVVQGAPLDLYGPYADDRTVIRQCQLGADGRMLAEERAPGGQVVGLREFRAAPSSGHCAVTIHTAAGTFVGPTFLCMVDRSEEEITTLRPVISISATEATLRFALSYQMVIDPYHRAMSKRLPTVTDYIVQCNLEGPRPKCTLPPRIGAYDWGRCGPK